MRARLILVGFLLASPTAARAQQATTGTITGVIRDSLFGGTVAGATVFASRAGSDSALLRLGTTDDKGHFRIDSLPAGTWTVTFSTDLLDSLQYSPREQRVELVAGRETRVDFATPSGATLRALACPGLAIDKGEGALLGQVLDAEDMKPIAGAMVAVAWNDFDIDRATLVTTTRTRTAGMASDSLGRYRICKLPTDVPLLVQVQHDGRAGSALALEIRDSVGIAVQLLEFSTTSARSIAALDSAIVRHDSVLPAMTGRASVAGIVRTSTGQPVSEAQVNVAGAAGVVRTDSSGHYLLHGLPAGTQQLEVRRVGYAKAQLPVALRDGATTTQDVALQRFVSLDSIRVIATRIRYTEFEARAKRGGFGRFLRAEDIERRSPWNTSDLMRMMPGFSVYGSGFNAKVVSRRTLGGGGLGRFGPSSECELNVVIDRMQHQDINLISPRDIAAMEVYASSAGAPVEYESRCGLIVIWTK